MAKLNKDLEVAMDKVDKFDESVKQMSTNAFSNAPVEETDPQTKLSQREIAKADGIYLKPERSIDAPANIKTGIREQFNEKFRKEFEFKSEYVPFIAEHKEIIGETIETWTKPFPGMPAQFWKVPTNKKVWGPRYLAEQISRKNYNRLVMTDTTTGSDGMGQYYGTLSASTRIARLDAKPARGMKTIAMSSDF